MEASSSKSAGQRNKNKPPQGGARPGGEGGGWGAPGSATGGGPSGFGVGGNDDPLAPARLWVQMNPAASLVGAFATGLLLGVLQK